MFGPTSRYANIETATTMIPDGAGGAREVRYVRRRFVLPADVDAVLAEHVVTEADRLDTITARYLGDPTQFWSVCDANGAMDPQELTAPENLGRIIRIPVPRA